MDSARFRDDGWSSFSRRCIVELREYLNAQRIELTERGLASKANLSGSQRKVSQSSGLKTSIAPVHLDEISTVNSDHSIKATVAFGAIELSLTASLSEQASAPHLAVAEELVKTVASILMTHRVYSIAKQVPFLQSRIEVIARELTASRSESQAGSIIVNRLKELLQADRMSLIHRARVLAISDAVEIDQRARVVQGILAKAFEEDSSATSQISTIAANEDRRLFAESASQTPETSQTVDSFQRVIVWADESGKDDSRASLSRSDSILVGEWKSEDRYRDAMLVFDEGLLSLQIAWERQLSWLGLPSFVSHFANVKYRKTLVSRRWFKYAVLLLVAVVSIAVLQIPVPFRVHARGVANPSTQRAVFVPHDGYVEEVSVAAREKVEIGQPLIRIASPLLRQEKTSLQGLIDAAEEKRQALSLRLNQVSTGASDIAAAQQESAMISAELKELTAEVESRRKQLEIVDYEMGKLLLKSPIAGIVIGDDLKQSLLDRPVQTGDVLFRIIDQSSPLCIELQVADKDIAHVRKVHDSGESSTCHFAFTTSPEAKHTAAIEWISPVARQRDRDGVFIDVRANVLTVPKHKVSFGESVDAQFDCGDRPLWFVWTRPLVETLQRNFWW